MLFTGEKIGVGMGRTRKDAQQQAAENALHSLAGMVFLGSFFLLRFTDLSSWPPLLVVIYHHFCFFHAHT